MAKFVTLAFLKKTNKHKAALRKCDLRRAVALYIGISLILFHFCVKTVYKLCSIKLQPIHFLIHIAGRMPLGWLLSDRAIAFNPPFAQT